MVTGWLEQIYHSLSGQLVMCLLPFSTESQEGSPDSLEWAASRSLFLLPSLPTSLHLSLPPSFPTPSFWMLQKKKHAH